MLLLFNSPIGLCYRKHEVQHTSFIRCETTCRRFYVSTKNVFFADFVKFHIFAKSYRYCINRYAALTSAIYYNSIILPNTHGVRIAGYLTSDIRGCQSRCLKNVPKRTKIGVWYDNFEPRLFDDPCNRISRPCIFGRYLRVVLHAQTNAVLLVIRCCLDLLKFLFFWNLAFLVDFADFALSLASSISVKPSCRPSKFLSREVFT